MTLPSVTSPSRPLKGPLSTASYPLPPSGVPEVDGDRQVPAVRVQAVLLSALALREDQGAVRGAQRQPLEHAAVAATAHMVHHADPDKRKRGVVEKRT